MQPSCVAVIGAGFAGSEAAWQLAQRGILTHLYEMRPVRNTEAHQSADFAELVCSNSFKSTRVENAHGLLKAELSLQNSLVMAGAHAARVPAGQALAVDRGVFSAWITSQLHAHQQVQIHRAEVDDLQAMLDTHACVIIATGPLTSPALATELSKYLGHDFLYFYDAITPVITSDSINPDVVYRASRYGKGSADYLNCPLNKEQYETFVNQVLQAEKVPFHDFESLRHFEGCLPIEVMAERGAMTLAFGPMKPVGLPDPRTGKPPYAVVQLRQENKQGTLYGMVGFQTKMTWPAQRRIFATLPGLGAGRICTVGLPAPQHFPGIPTPAQCRTGPALRAAALLCRTNHRGGRLYRILRHGNVCGQARGSQIARRSGGHPGRHHHDRRIGALCHQLPPGQVPTHECGFWPARPRTFQTGQKIPQGAICPTGPGSNGKTQNGGNCPGKQDGKPHQPPNGTSR